MGSMWVGGDVIEYAIFAIALYGIGGVQQEGDGVWEWVDEVCGGGGCEYGGVVGMWYGECDGGWGCVGCGCVMLCMFIVYYGMWIGGCCFSDTLIMGMQCMGSSYDF